MGSNYSGLSTPTANAIRLANNKRIIFTEAHADPMYENNQGGGITGKGITTTQVNLKSNKITIGGSK
jgi:hypothetical protein